MDVADKLAELMRIVARENARQRNRSYNLHYLRGKWINLDYMPYGGMEAVDVIRKDTPATIEGLTEAFRAIAACIAETI